MTRKLYYEDTYLKKFEAKVEAMEPDNEGRWHIRLDSTAFYPEGGGQPSDQGKIAGALVEYVYEKDGLIWHVADSQPLIGQTVNCSLNWGRRFHFMQQHLGQHIISAVFLRDLGAHTVAVHFGVDTSSIDLSLPLTATQIADAELAVNDVIYSNTPVETLYPSDDEIKEHSRRKIPAGSGPVRIVKIGDLDYAPCCGTHNRSTGEVGVIKFYRHESYKGGVRIGFACGGAAVIRYRRIYGELSRMQKLLSVPESDVVPRTEKLLSELGAMRKEREALMERILEAEAEKMVAAAIPIGSFKLVCEMMYATNQGDLGGLFRQLTQRPGVVAVLGGEVPGGAMLMFGAYRGERRVDVRDIFNQSIEFIGGRGGGSAVSCQGMGPDSSRLREVVSAAGRVMEDLLSRVVQETEI